MDTGQRHGTASQITKAAGITRGIVTGIVTGIGIATGTKGSMTGKCMLKSNSTHHASRPVCR